MPQPGPHYEIREANWPDDLPALREVREKVFIEEQGVPREMEWDEADPLSLHLVAEDADGRPIGTVRLLPNGQIGRMAVLPAWRNQGVGSRLLSRVLEKADSGKYPHLFLNAQSRAVVFYRRFGFSEQGEEFMEAGIPHYRMELKIDDPKCAGNNPSTGTG